MNGSSRWAIFISGRGSNLQSLLTSARSAEIVLVLSSKAEAEGIYRARRAGVKTQILDKKVDWAELHKSLLEFKISHIFLAGFMKVIPSEFVEKWRGKIVNIHPSLLPSYPGLRSIERAYKEGAELGATLHEVIPEVDRGQIIYQESVGFAQEYPSLEEAQLAIHRVEHKILREYFERRPR